MLSPPAPPGPGRFSVSTARDIDRYEIVVSGELDIATAPRLLAAADEARQAATPVVHIDLSALEVMDSTGLKVLLDLHRDLTAAGSRLTLSRGHGSVQRVIALCGLEDVFEFVPPPADAVP